MQTFSDKFDGGRRTMRDAFIEMYELAVRAGVDHDVARQVQYRFFDGNQAVNEEVHRMLLPGEPTGVADGRG